MGRFNRKGGAGSKQALALANPSANQEELRAHYQSRLGLFVVASIISFLVLIAAINVMYWVAPSTRPLGATAINKIAFFAFLFYGVVGFKLRKGTLDLHRLFAWDGLQLTIVGLLIAASAWYSRDKTVNLYSTFFYFTLLIFSRAAIVPSSGKRTFLLSCLTFLPIGAVALVTQIWHAGATAIEPPFYFLGVLFYGATSMGLAALASNVIYGLRRQLSAVEQLGQYTLLEKLGQGGMGIVYKAEHSMLRRPTAIKLLPIENVGEDSVLRFEEEVQRTSELTHPNTIVIYDYGRSPDGMFYYAMELLDGFDLDVLIRRFGPQPAERVVPLLLQLCGALGEAHSKGLIHRDVKPANIFLSRRGGINDFIKLLDFGLVMERKQLLAETQNFAGTPAFASPESIKEPRSVGPTSDIYSLGCVAYYLLTGSLLFEAENAMQMCIAHVDERPPDVMDKSELCISEDLNRLVMGCLEKTIAKRPQTMEDLAEALKALALEPWCNDKSGKWWSEKSAQIRTFTKHDLENTEMMLAENKAMTVLKTRKL